MHRTRRRTGAAIAALTRTPTITTMPAPWRAGPAVRPSEDRPLPTTHHRRARVTAAALALALLTTLLALVTPTPAAAGPLLPDLGGPERIFTAITAAENSMCGVTVDADLYCWGVGDRGTLGTGTTDRALIPVQLTTPSGVSWESVDGGSGQTCAITTDGVAYCWGGNHNGSTGTGPPTDPDGVVWTPTPVVTPDGVTWDSISAGLNHTCAITADGDAYCWGIDATGQLGDGLDETASHTPLPVAAPAGVTWDSITTGGDHTCGLTTDSSLYCWGANDWGQLGDHGAGSAAVPRLVPAPTGVTWASVTAGGLYTCATTTAGAILCWGVDQSGQLGDGPQDSSAQGPVDVGPPPRPEGVTWASVSASTNGAHTCATTTDGAGFCWGNDSWDGLGDDATVPGEIRHVPTAVATPVGLTWTTITVGMRSSCGLTNTRSGYCWGDPLMGPRSILGDGFEDPSDVPVRVGGRSAQTITFPQPAGMTPGQAAVDLGATASSGLPVAYTATGTCTIVDGTKVQPTGAGSCAVTANQAGHAEWAQAPAVERTFSIAKASQTITFPQPAAMTPGQTAATLGATASSGLTVGYDADGPCTIVEGTKVQPTGAGTCTVTATQAGNDSYTAATPVERDITIASTAQAITFPALAGMTVDDPPAALGATASSGLTVTYSASGPCAIVAGTKVSPTGAGSCTVTASQAGDGTHAAAAPIERSFAIAKAATQTALTADVLVAGVGEEITFEAAVTGPGTPEGNVTFTATPDAGTPRTETDEVHVGSGTARYSPHDLPVGTWTVVARYDGSADHQTSTSAALVVRVAGPAEEAVAAAYGAVLGREPDPAGLRYWAEQLGTKSPAAVADALAKSKEGRTRLVTVTYQTVLGRTPGTNERTYWVGELLAGRTTAERLTAELYGTITAGPVDALYRIHLGRTPSTADRTFWGPRVDTAAERKQASLGTGRTPEALQVLVRRATTAACGEGAAAPTGAALTAATDHARATAGDIVRVTARLAATHCPAT